MSGSRAKKERREGTRKTHIHESFKMDLQGVNWGHDKKTYWERRKKGLTGQIRAPLTYDRGEDEEGNVILLPSSGKYPPKISSHLQGKVRNV